MHDGKALQAGTSHYFGNGFAKAFDITYADRENKLIHPFQTSWGSSTRMIGGIIMTHGDDNGLVLPPAIAPIQVAVIPVQMHKEGVADAARAVADRLRAHGIRVKVDDSDNSPGWKFAEYEMKGVPLRIEIGPRDIAENKCVMVTRTKREKTFVSLDELEASVDERLRTVRDEMYEKALENRKRRSYDCTSIEEIGKAVAEHGDGFAFAMWCGSEECEDKVKELTGLGSRCVPLDQRKISDKCVCCGKPADKMVCWGKAY